MACWINHPLRPDSTTSRPDGMAHELVGRLHMLDLRWPAPRDSMHQHLECLGTRPGHCSREIIDVLLRHQCGLTDLHGRPAY